MQRRLTRIWQYLGAVMSPQATKTEEPLPAPPGPQEHHAHVEFMAERLFGLTAEEVGVAPVMTTVSLDDLI